MDTLIIIGILLAIAATIVLYIKVNMTESLKTSSCNFCMTSSTSKHFILRL
mgnify:CR=1 FL=1